MLYLLSNDNPQQQGCVCRGMRTNSCVQGYIPEEENLTGFNYGAMCLISLQASNQPRQPQPSSTLECHGSAWNEGPGEVTEAEGTKAGGLSCRRDSFHDHGFIYHQFTELTAAQIGGYKNIPVQQILPCPL